MRSIIQLPRENVKFGEQRKNDEYHNREKHTHTHDGNRDENRTTDEWKKQAANMMSTMTMSRYFANRKTSKTWSSFTWNTQRTRFTANRSFHLNARIHAPRQRQRRNQIAQNSNWSARISISFFLSTLKNWIKTSEQTNNKRRTKFYLCINTFYVLFSNLKSKREHERVHIWNSTFSPSHPCQVSVIRALSVFLFIHSITLILSSFLSFLLWW